VSKSSKSSRTVLCIGSEAMSLYQRCAFLKEHGWRVFSATSGHEGIFRFAAEPVDVVVLDLNHDGAEGALIAGELKRMRPNVPIIILVNEGHAVVEGALESADAVVPRSDQFHDLLKALEALPGSS
jgi:DNA-binding response OmpR family regulator